MSHEVTQESGESEDTHWRSYGDDERVREVEAGYDPRDALHGNQTIEPGSTVA